MGKVIPFPKQAQRFTNPALGEFPVVFAQFDEPIKDMCVYEEWLLVLTKSGKAYALDSEGSKTEITADFA